MFTSIPSNQGLRLQLVLTLKYSLTAGYSHIIAHPGDRFHLDYRSLRSDQVRESWKAVHSLLDNLT